MEACNSECMFGQSGKISKISYNLDFGALVILELLGQMSTWWYYHYL